MTLRAITIDGPTSKDLDDALWVEEREGGGVALSVFVADPAAIVEIGSDADKRAIDMIETHYYGAGSRPMLPHQISEKDASLLPHRERSALHVRLEFDEQGQKVRAAVTCGVAVKSLAQLHYGQVIEILGQPNHPHHALMRQLEVLSRVLLQRRRNEGALALYDLSTGLLTSEEGAPRWAEDDKSTLGHLIVQEAMIAANGAVAEFCLRSSIPILYRNHEASLAAPSRDMLQQWLAEMITSPRDLAMQRARVLQTVLERARYGTELRGHFGLALGAYMHATSPIRRLADLLNHRQLRAALRGEPPPYSRADLDAFADKINEWKDAQRKKREERLKEKADEVLSRRAAKGMSHLEPKAFSRVVKLAARAEDAPGEAFCAEVARRCQDGSLQPLDAYFVMWRDGEKWAALRAEVARFLDRRRHVGASVVAISATMEKAPATLTPAWQQAGKFAARAQRGDVQASGTGSSKKAAEQDAVVGLFYAMAGTCRAEPAADLEAPSPAPPPPLPLPDPSAVDPISELQRYCQALPVELPSYGFKTQDARGVPHFTCEVSVPDLKLSATSGIFPNKKEAKRDAAARAIRALGQLLPA